MDNFVAKKGAEGLTLISAASWHQTKTGFSVAEK